MATTVYTYSISGDFPNQSADHDSLLDELVESTVDTIGLSYITINSPPNVCSICFEDALSAGDKTTMDGVVAAHQGSTRVLVEHYFYKNAIRFDTTSATYDLAHRHTIQNMVTGNYILDFSVTVRTNKAGGRGSIRISSPSIGTISEKTFKGDDPLLLTGFEEIQLVGMDHDLDIEILRITGGGTIATLDNSAINIRRRA